MPWYLMSRDKQLSYAHLLNRLQNGTLLQIGPFATLNFETFSDVSIDFLTPKNRTQDNACMFSNLI